MLQSRRCCKQTQKEDTEVDVIMTKNACEFVDPLTFRTLSKNPVVTSTFAAPELGR